MTRFATCPLRALCSPLRPSADDRHRAHLGSLTATAGQVQRRVRQYRALADEATCLRLARSLVHAKLEGSLKVLWFSGR